MESTNLDFEQATFVLKKVNYRGISEATAYLYDRNEN
jgi:hypothetical protein